MQIGKDTVVSISYDLCDASGKLIEKTPSPVSYLHGEYDAIFLVPGFSLYFDVRLGIS